MLKLSAESVFLASTPTQLNEGFLRSPSKSPNTTELEADATDTEFIQNSDTPSSMETMQGDTTSDCVEDYFDMKRKAPSKIYLQGNIYLTLSTWKGVERAHLRAYVNNYPTKTGLTFSAVRYANLVFQSDAISYALDRVRKGEQVDFKLNIGGNVFATVQSPFLLVKLFKYYVPKGANQPIPSSYGIVLGEINWINFINHMFDVKSMSTSFRDAKPCWLELDHQNQMGALQCKECHFFDGY